ncbi:MAG TPA: nucleotidyltransferase family protein, partial [Thermoanaerobaculia bacterium]|nr:nucleotidyltransferase family protein [Thermoanaerobaculia bacterium]
MKAAGQLAIPVPHAEIAEFCRRWGVRKLSFFGSVVRDDFGPDSDVDVLVEFQEGKTPGLKIISMENELAALLGREVDLVITESLNRWIRGRVLREAVEQY